MRRAPAKPERQDGQGLLGDESRAGHDAVHAWIDRLCGMQVDDEKYASRFTVLCEYVLHHVQEEEGGPGGQTEARTGPPEWRGPCAG